VKATNLDRYGRSPQTYHDYYTPVKPYLKRFTGLAPASFLGGVVVPDGYHFITMLEKFIQCASIKYQTARQSNPWMGPHRQIFQNFGLI